MGKIFIVQTCYPGRFENEVNNYLKDGYKLISSHCTSGYSNQFESMEILYQAILFNDTETLSEEELKEQEDFRKKFSHPLYEDV